MSMHALKVIRRWAAEKSVPYHVERIVVALVLGIWFLNMTEGQPAPLRAALLGVFPCSALVSACELLRRLALKARGAPTGGRSGGDSR